MVEPSQERKVEDARASLFARASELGRRMHEVRAKLDVRAHIVAHPRAATGIAFAIGALLAFPRRSKSSAPHAEAKSGLVGVAMATLGSLAFTVVKNVAMNHASGALAELTANGRQRSRS